jgi:uncharacterized membrane protein
MQKRVLTKSQFNFLEEELEYCKKSNLITLDQKNEILDHYSMRGLNFVKVILTIGCVLIGLGVLSFIASNWDAMSKIIKFLVIIAAYIGVNITSYKLQESYPKTSRSLLYLGASIYGAGIFLVGQTFNYGGNFTDAFFLWGTGILPLAFLFKDRIIFIFAHILFLVYINGSFQFNDMSYWILLILPVVYYINIHLYNSKIGTLFNNLLLLNTIGYFLEKFNLDGLFVTFVFLGIGILMSYIPIRINRDIFKLVGGLTFGIAGLFLTSHYVWDNFSVFGDGTAISIIFSVVFIIYLLLQTRKGNLISLVFICATIFRYYFDTFFDFMPKSIFFLCGGLILLAFGIYFERARNKRGGDFIEK